MTTSTLNLEALEITLAPGVTLPGAIRELPLARIDRFASYATAAKERKTLVHHRVPVVLPSTDSSYELLHPPGLWHEELTRGEFNHTLALVIEDGIDEKTAQDIRDLCAFRDPVLAAISGDAFLDALYARPSLEDVIRRCAQPESRTLTSQMIRRMVGPAVGSDSTIARAKRRAGKSNPRSTSSTEKPTVDATTTPAAPAGAGINRSCEQRWDEYAVTHRLRRYRAVLHDLEGFGRQYAERFNQRLLEQDADIGQLVEKLAKLDGLDVHHDR